jgi:drug/metabolite transporter (DMT)-like permease
MTVTGLSLIPLALVMTDFSQKINYGFSGPYLTAIIQILNAIGALTIVYAFRYGKAIIVSPLTNAIAPVITIIISLSIYKVIPEPIVIIGMVMAILSILFLTFDGSEAEPEAIKSLKKDLANE